MAEVAEAPLKRKLETSSEAVECKKPRDCVPLHMNAVEPAPGNSQEVPVQSNGEHKPDGQVNPSGETEASKSDRVSELGDSEVRLPEQAPCSSYVRFEEPGAVGRGEVLEQDEVDEDDDGGQMSELDTENDSEDEDDDEDADSDEDKDGSDDDSDDEVEEELGVTSTSSSLQVEAAQKGKGKEKVDDFKGKGILPLDKGKGKAIAEDESGPVSDEDDAGYLSEDPLEEVDLNNILPTRTRRRSSTHHYDFVDQGNDDDDDDDDDDDGSDA